MVHGGCKGFLRRLFGKVEVADESNQDGDDPAPMGAIDRFNACWQRYQTYPIVNIFPQGCRFNRPPFDSFREAHA